MDGHVLVDGDVNALAVPLGPLVGGELHDRASTEDDELLIVDEAPVSHHPPVDGVQFVAAGSDDPVVFDGVEDDGVEGRAEGAVLVGAHQVGAGRRRYSGIYGLPHAHIAGVMNYLHAGIGGEGDARGIAVDDDDDLDVAAGVAEDVLDGLVAVLVGDRGDDCGELLHHIPPVRMMVVPMATPSTLPTGMRGSIASGRVGGAEGEAEGDADGEGDIEAEGEGEIEAEAEALGEPEGEWEGEAEGEGLTEAEGDGEIEAEGEGETEADGLIEGE